MTFRARVKAWLEAHPVVTTRAAKSIDRAGAHRAAERLVGAANLVLLRPPYPSARPFAMTLLHGTDQITAALAADGWLGFEPPVPTVFAALVRARGGLVLDVGANTGFYSLVAAAVGPEVEVHAFEPYSPVAERLRANVRINRTGSRIQVFGKAVGRTTGRAALYVPEPSHGWLETSASLSPEFGVERRATTTEVAVTTLDEHLATTAQGHRVSVVKVDVEGLEHDVLASGTRLLGRDRPYVIVEVLPTSDIGALEQVRDACGYVDVVLRRANAVFRGAIAFDPDGWNHLFVPVEDLDHGLAIVESCGLVVQR